MKRAQRKDLFRELKKSLNRYISILLITGLGVAFYAGVRSSEPDMQLTAKKFYDETEFMDLRVIGTMGMTDGDVEALARLDGVAAVEGAYRAEAFLVTELKNYQLALYSIGESVNQVRLSAGRMPEAPDECLLDEFFFDTHGYRLGDTVTLATEDGELSELLRTATYTVVGCATYAEYLSWSRGTVSIGTGSADAFVFLPREAFASEVYSCVYLTVEGAKDYNCFQNDYEELVGAVKERAEAIADVRGAIRFEEATASVRAELTDAEEELAGAQKELADARVKAAQAWEELEKGKLEIADGRAELAQKEAELADGERELEEKKAELADGERRLADGKAELSSGRQALLAAKQEVAEKRQELSAARAQYEESKAALAAFGLPMTEELLAAEAELAAAEQVLLAAEAELEAKEAAFLEAEAELAESERELSDGRAALLEAETALAEGRQAILDGRAALLEAEAKAADGERELSEAEEEIANGERELSDGEAELADARRELEELAAPEWYVLDRNTVQSFVEYGMDAERIGLLGKVFPAVFYLVATLVSLTTMTRMVEEERIQIGTMKALGYGKASIAGKYLWYSLSASVLGGLLGIAVGSYVLPQVIISAYQILYSHLPAAVTPVQWDLSLISLAIAVLCTTAATALACGRELAAVPAVLMRPAAPKEGKRVFLEYVKPLWQALSFSWKATCRNLFRYKKRFFMTVFGIGGCMALLMVAFGLRDSIGDIVDNQYQNIWTYDAYLSVNDTALEEDALRESGFVTDSMYVRQVTIDAASESATKEIRLFVPERLNGLPVFLKLKDRVTDEEYRLTEKGAVISEKLAKILGVSVGDTIELVEDETTRHPVTVTAVAENYLYHYVYVSARQYEELFGKAPEYNQLFLELTEMSEEEKEEFSRSMLAEPSVDSISHIADLQKQVSDMMNSLNLVVVVLILSAALLAFIVLYNLNNINIIERRRELATLRVLGFYDGELAMYVYRENILLTAFGIACGVGIGYFLHRFVIETCEIDMIMFGRDISGFSYLASIGLTVLFSIVVNAGMFYKLRRIDMVESLKSME